MSHKRALLRISKVRKNREQEQLIDKLKKGLKKEEEYIEKCEEYDKDIDFVDNVNITFDDDLDVSAKTVNGEIFLNGKLFEEGDWADCMRYVLHEMVHVFQQNAGKVKGKVDKDHYLDDKNEQEAFQAQISYMADNESPEELQQYLEQLLDHHDIKGKERKEKIKELTKDIY